MYQEDYIMRLVHESVKMLMSLLFHIDVDAAEDYEGWDAEDIIAFDHMRKLVELGKIEEAENRLIESYDLNDKNKFMVALRFYDYLNTKDDKYLEDHHFSRMEVSEGMKAAARFYGYEDMIAMYDFPES